MLTRPTTWLNTKTLKPVYGIELRINGKWMGYAKDGEAQFWTTEKARDAERAKLRKIPELDFLKTATIAKAKQVGLTAQAIPA